MIKIGILLQSEKEVGGIYQYCLSIIDAANNLNKKKFKITYFYTEKLWKKKIPSKSKKIFIKKNFFKKILRKLIFGILPTNESWRIFRNLLYEDVKIMNKSDCDYIIFPSQNRAGYLTKKKSITMIHDLMHRYERHFAEYKNGVFEMREKHYNMICKYSENVIVDSNMGKKHVIESYNYPKNKIYVLPFTVPSYLSKKQNKRIKLKLPKKYLFYPAQFWEHKNHMNLISALKISFKEIDDLHLVLSGVKKSFFEKIFDKIKENNLEKKILVLGRVKDEHMKYLYKNSFATVFVSLLGPTNIPPLEAISLNSPLICSNVYAMKEQLKNAALYVDPNDPKDISKAINNIYKNVNLRKKLISNGRKVFRFKTQNQFNKNFEEIIKNISN